MRSAPRPAGSGRIHRRLALVLIVFALVASACGGGVDATASATASGSDAATSASDALTGEFATFDDTTLDLASLQGEDVVLWFWAPW